MAQWIWVQEDVACAIHLEQLREHGGGQGVRDLALLQTALARPENLLADGDPDAAALAASYAYGMARNHPFVDGNKRTAYVVCELFLALNGYVLISSDADSTLTFLALAAGELDEAALADWLRANLTAL